MLTKTRKNVSLTHFIPKKTVLYSVPNNAHVKNTKNELKITVYTQM